MTSPALPPHADPTRDRAPSAEGRPGHPTDPSTPGRVRLRWGRGAAVLLACATVAVATTGCGSSAGGGTGDATTYARTYDQACRSMVDGLDSVLEEFGDAEDSAAIDPEGTTETLKRGMTQILDTVDDGFEAMSTAEAPKKWSGFQDDLRVGAKSFRKAVDEARDVVDDVDELSDFTEVETKFDALGFSNDDETESVGSTGPDDFPSDLLRAAPSCKDLQDL